MKIIATEIRSREFFIIINFRMIISRKIILVVIANISINLYIVIKNVLWYYNTNYNVNNGYFIKVYSITTLINGNKGINYNKRGILI